MLRRTLKHLWNERNIKYFKNVYRRVLTIEILRIFIFIVISIINITFIIIILVNIISSIVVIVINILLFNNFNNFVIIHIVTNISLIKA